MPEGVTELAITLFYMNAKVIPPQITGLSFPRSGERHQYCIEQRMLASILQYLYTLNSSNIDSHHQCNRQRHPQQQRHNSQQYQILSPWLRQGAFNNSFYINFECLISGSRLATSTRPTNAPGISDAVFITKCYAVFFIVSVLMASCCDARRFYTRVGVTGGSKRVIRESHNTASNSSNSVPSYSMNVMASINSTFSVSSPPTEINIHGDQQSLDSSGKDDKKDDDWIQEESAKRTELVTLLISTLEKLSVLETTDSSCFRLEKIVQNIVDGSSSPRSSLSTTDTSPSSGRTKLGVFLYFEEVHIPSVNISNTETVHADNASTNSNNNSTVLRHSCVSHPVVEVHRASLPLQRKGAENRHGTIAIEDTDNSTAESDVNVILHAGRLSRTQIVVISTCSAIIGMFFMVAAFLRIRNYIKRSRLEQEIANRPKFRSCSVALRGATQSMEQLRRDSLASKTSHQNSDTTKGSNSSHTNVSSPENSSASSPRHDPDTAPLLLLTKAPQTNDPSTPTELKYIDEDAALPQKKVNLSPCTTNSVHSDCRLELSGQGSSEVIIMEGIIAMKGGSKAPPGNTDTLSTSKQNGQLVSSKVEGNVNPSFSNGSICCYVLSGPEAPNMEPVKRKSGHLNVMNKMEREQHDTLVGFIQQSRSNSEVTTHGNMISNSKKDTIHVDHHSQQKIQRGQIGDVNKYNDHLSAEHFVQVDNTYTEYLPANPTQASVTSNSQWQNIPCSLEKQVGAEETCKRRGVQNMDTVTGYKLCTFLGISNFGLSQSDESLSTFTNQGNEFFGQTEYHHPYDGCEVCETCYGDTTINSNDCDKSEETLGNCVVSELNQLNRNTKNVVLVHHGQPRLSSDSATSVLHNVAKTNEQKCISLSHTDIETHVKPLVESLRTDEQLICDNGFKEITLTENVFCSKPSLPPNCTTDPQKADMDETPLLTDSANICITQTNTLTILDDEASSGTASDLPSITTSASHETHHSLQHTDQESSAEENVLPVSKCVIQPALPVSPHESQSHNDHLSCQQFQILTDLPGQCVLTQQHFTTSIETPLPDRDDEQDDSNHNQSIMPQEKHPNQYAHDHQEKDASKLEVKECCQMTSTLFPKGQSPSINNSNICHQLLPLQTLNQSVNSSTC